MTGSHMHEKDERSYKKAWRGLKELNPESEEYKEFWAIATEIEDRYNLRGQPLRTLRG